MTGHPPRRYFLAEFSPLADPDAEWIRDEPMEGDDELDALDGHGGFSRTHEYQGAREITLAEWDTIHEK